MFSFTNFSAAILNLVPSFVCNATLVSPRQTFALNVYRYVTTCTTVTIKRFYIEYQFFFRSKSL